MFSREEVVTSRFRGDTPLRTLGECLEGRDRGLEESGHAGIYE